MMLRFVIVLVILVCYGYAYILTGNYSDENTGHRFLVRIPLNRNTREIVISNTHVRVATSIAVSNTVATRYPETVLGNNGKVHGMTDYKLTPNNNPKKILANSRENKYKLTPNNNPEKVPSINGNVNGMNINSTNSSLLPEDISPSSQFPISPTPKQPGSADETPNFEDKKKGLYDALAIAGAATVLGLVLLFFIKGYHGYLVTCFVRWRGAPASEVRQSDAAAPSEESVPLSPVVTGGD